MAVLKQECDKLEVQINELKARTVPLSERLNEIYRAEAERQIERQQLLAEWPAMETRERGEALRRLFKTVTLFWDATFHPASTKPTRPRKTDRSGRYSYTLQPHKFSWQLANTDLGGCK